MNYLLNLLAGLSVAGLLLAAVWLFANHIGVFGAITVGGLMLGLIIHSLDQRRTARNYRKEKNAYYQSLLAIGKAMEAGIDDKKVLAIWKEHYPISAKNYTFLSFESLDCNEYPAGYVKRVFENALSNIRAQAA